MIVFLPALEQVGIFEARTTLFLLRVQPTPNRAPGSEEHDAEVVYFRRGEEPLKVGTRPNRQLAEGAAILKALDLAERECARLTFPRKPCGTCGRAEAIDGEPIPTDINAPEASMLCWARTVGKRHPEHLERANIACEAHLRKVREGRA